MIVTLENGYKLQGPETFSEEAKELTILCNAEMERFTSLARNATEDEEEEKFFKERTEVYDDYFKDQFSELGYEKIE
jgi:hypothetical protein